MATLEVCIVRETNEQPIMSNTASAAYKEALTCPVCLETYTRQTKIPKSLPCGHSLCLKQCLETLMEKRYPECPLCRTAIVGGIEDIKTNFTVMDLLEVMDTTVDQVQILQTTSGHTTDEGDYVCMKCLVQICSFSQLSSHTDDSHNCISVIEFIEKSQQDVSKMNALINGLSWPEEFQLDTTSPSVMATYFNLKESISTRCDKILQLLQKKKLNLTKIRDLQKQVKKDHNTFKAASDDFKQEILKAKKHKILETQLSKYRQKLIKLKLPENIHKKTSFRDKILPFETLKDQTESLSESLSQQLKMKPLDIIATEENLHDIGENIGVIEKYITDITQAYRSFLLGEIGITGNIVEPHHVFRIIEAIEVMSLEPDRHCIDIMHRCNDLIHKFVASRDHIGNSCKNLLEELQGYPIQLGMVEEKVVVILKEMETCKVYFEDIYREIGNKFVTYGRSYMERYVQKCLVDQDTACAWQSTKVRPPFMEKLMKEFEKCRETSKTRCQEMIKYLSQKDSDISLVPDKFKEIDMSAKLVKYRLKFIEELSAMVLRCHEAMEEFQRLILPKPMENTKTRKCFENGKEVRRLWQLVEWYTSKTLSFDVQVISMHASTMGKIRNSTASLLMLSKSQLNDLKSNMIKMAQIMELRESLHNRLSGFPRKLQVLYQRHHQKQQKLSLVFDITDRDPKKMVDRIKSYSLQDLLLLSEQAEGLDELFEEIWGALIAECNVIHAIALMRSKRLKLALNWLPQYFIPERNSEEWNIAENVQENQHQWEAIVDIEKSNNYDVYVLRSHLNRLLSLSDKLTNASNQIMIACFKAILVVLVVVISFLKLWFWP